MKSILFMCPFLYFLFLLVFAVSCTHASENSYGGEKTMFDREGFSNYLKSLKADDESIKNTMGLVDEYLSFVNSDDKNYDFDGVEAFSKKSIAGKDDALQRIIALARFCKFTNRTKGMIYLITLSNTIGVLESIQERSRIIAGDEITGRIFSGINPPPLGSSIEDYPDVIKSLLKNMKENLPPCKYRKILAGNHHQLPVEYFIEHKDKFEKLGSIDEFLKYRHQKIIEEMEKCMNEKRLWYEQNITPEVIEYMNENQEVSSGIRQGNKIFITKIPYMVDEYLKTENEDIKPYLACHCPFVRSSVKEGKSSVPDEWCYCSGGFHKLIFDIIFGEEVEVELLESIISGDPRCRFSITIPDKYTEE